MTTMIGTFSHLPVSSRVAVYRAFLANELAVGAFVNDWGSGCPLVMATWAVAGDEIFRTRNYCQTVTEALGIKVGDVENFFKAWDSSIPIQRKLFKVFAFVLLIRALFQQRLDAVQTGFFDLRGLVHCSAPVLPILIALFTLFIVS